MFLNSWFLWVFVTLIAFALQMSGGAGSGAFVTLAAALMCVAVIVLGFAPTIRKSWNKPFTETLTFYYLNSFRFGLAVIALQRYSIVTALYPITWLVANSFFALMLVIRRKQVGKE